MSTVSGTTIGRLNQLDAGSRAKLEAACNYINAEVSQVRNRILTLAGVCAALGLIVVAVLWNRGLRDPRLPIFVVVGIVATYATYQWRGLNKQYKQIVVSRIVKALGSGMTYSPASRFTKDDFIKTDLYLQHPQTWSAEDEVNGSKNAVTYSILEAKGTRTEGSGRNRRTVVIFRGTIARLDFNKNFFGQTIVVPENDSKIMGLFGHVSNRHNKELCQLENVEFEAQYSVYGTDQQQARYILTPKLMELVLDASNAYPGLRMSFQDSSVFITIPSTQNRFEIGSFFAGRVTPETAFGELVEVVALAERLIDTLDLETRIWTRV